MRRTLLVVFSFICVVVLLYLGNSLYEDKIKKQNSVNTIEEYKYFEEE